MSERNSKSPRRIQVLPKHVYQKIAAGEVIERPASVLRELLDNSIDAGSRNVEVFLTKGGLEEIRVVDDGEGMSKEDIALSIQPHATSKVESLEDLSKTTTLGFRGEALASIAATGRLEILSSVFGENEGNRLYVESGRVRKSGAGKATGGTTVSIKDLFYSIPARKQFLKAPATEQKMCRQVFTDKALPFPGISFKLYADGNQLLYLPPSGLLERGRLLFTNVIGGDALYETSYFEEQGFGIQCLLGNPEYFRRDRRYMYIYVNRRRVDEYGLIQAVEYGYGEYLPKGRFPYAFVFLSVPPDSADFNIHPAKKEVRLHDKKAIHRVLHRFIRTTLLEEFGGSRTHERPTGGFDQTQDKREGKLSFYPEKSAHSPSYYPANRPATSVYEKLPDFAAVKTKDTGTDSSDRIRYLGQVFSLFLIASRDDTVYIIDQHAAHERFLYDRLNEQSPGKQRLLVPVRFECDTGDSEYIGSMLSVYERLGVELESLGENRWQLNAVPENVRIKPDGIIDLITGLKGDESGLKNELYAGIACKSAIQDGEVLDAGTAKELIRKALELPLPRCPHGRPVWHTISRKELFSLVGRKI